MDEAKVSMEVREDMGSIRVMLPQLMAENNMNISDLARFLDVNWQTAKKKRDGESPLTKDELEQLCERWGVTPGDIYVFRPEDEGAT